MRRRYRFLSGFALCLAVLGPWPPHGWTAEPGLSNPPALNEKELLAYKAKGRGILSGQAFLSASSGKAITQAGVSVHLIPATQYTRYWFDHNVRTSACPPKGEPAPGESVMAPRQSADCAQDALTQLLAQQRLLPYLRTTRANPTGHFWFTKIPAGRYYIVSVIEGAGSRQDEQVTGIAWLTIDLEAGEKAANLVLTNCRSSLC